MSYSDSTSFDKSNSDKARLAVINTRVLDCHGVPIKERQHIEKVNPMVADI